MKPTPLPVTHHGPLKLQQQTFCEAVRDNWLTAMAQIIHMRVRQEANTLYTKTEEYSSGFVKKIELPEKYNVPYRIGSDHGTVFRLNSEIGIFWTKGLVRKKRGSSAPAG
jgi:hypothetical protein